MNALGSIFSAVMAYRLYILPLMFLMILIEFPVPHTAGMVIISFAFALCMMGGYLFNKYTDYKEDNVNIASLPVQRNGMLFWIAASFIVLPIIALIPNIYLLAIYIFPVLLGLWYSFPISIGGKKVRLKQVLLFKNMTSAIIWASFPAFVPAFYMGWAIGDAEINIFVIYFCIVLAMEITWDVRDIEGDRQHGIQTIANTWGVSAVRVITTLLVLSVFIRNFNFLVENPVFMAATLAHLGLSLIVTKDRGALFYQSFGFIWLTAFLVYMVMH